MSEPCEPCEGKSPQKTTIHIPPRNTDRFVVVIDDGKGACQIHQNLTKAKAMVLMVAFGAPAVFLRLPAGAYGDLHISKMISNDGSTTPFVFSYEIVNSSEIAGSETTPSPETLTSAMNDFQSEMESENSDEVLTTYVVECPPMSGIFTTIQCETGKKGACVNEGGTDVVRCVAGNG